MTELSRRRFVLGTGAVAATGALAGCSGNGDGNGNGGNGDGNGDGNGNGDGPQGRADSFLSDNANNYESLEDHTGESEVTVNVGAGDNGFSFAPPGIVVDAGTTIVWEWTGEGGGHNVVPEGDTDFEDFGVSERIDEAGHTEEHTFEEAGVAMYVCEPHRAQGMYGAIVVE